MIGQSDVPPDFLLVRDAEVALADLAVLVHLVGALLARLRPLQRYLLQDVGSQVHNRQKLAATLVTTGHNWSQLI